MLQAETEPDELNEENEVEATAPPSSLYPELDSNPDVDIQDPEMEEEPLLAAQTEEPPQVPAVTPPPEGSPAAASTPRLYPSAPSQSPDDRKSDDTASAKSTEL